MQSGKRVMKPKKRVRYLLLEGIKGSREQKCAWVVVDGNNLQETGGSRFTNRTTSSGCTKNTYMRYMVLSHDTLSRSSAHAMS